MERYGYLYTSEIETDNLCLPTRQISITHVHNYFYKNLSDCIRNAITETIKEHETRHYIKILKNADVIQEIHNTSEESTYGYLYLCLKKESNTDHIYLFSPSHTLFSNMLDCVTCEKSYKENDFPKTVDNIIKLGYFVLLKDDDLMRELHRPICM